MPSCYDYLVIGSGPAGCIVAGELKRMGFQVCVLEKEAENYRKVCGDGVGAATISVLKQIGFPVKYFDDAGAIKIHKFIVIREEDKGHESFSEEIQEEKGKLVYGLARNKIDGVFKRYLTQNDGVDIIFNEPVENIVTVTQVDGDTMYDVNGYLARKIIIAAGASARIALDGRPVVSPASSNPVGVSAILRAYKAKEPFFLFDFKKEYKGTYGWLFCIGDREYNAGLWLKYDKSMIWKEFDRFLDTRVKEYLGSEYEFICATRGSIMGIGDKRFLNSDSVFIIGDSANTSNPLDGEGISKAVLDAIKLVNYIKSL